MVQNVFLPPVGVSPELPAARGRLPAAGVAALCIIAIGCARSRPPSDARAVALSSGDHTVALRHEGRARAYIVHVPPQQRSALPVVVAFHGGGGEARGFQEYAGLDAVADREGFAVVYPYGSGVLPRRLLTWNAGGCCGWAMNNAVDDVAFSIAVLDDLAGRLDIDARRVFVTGHSNGAMMAYRLAAERDDRVAAVAAVAGAMNLDTFGPARPVAILHIHSLDDPRAPYNGGPGPPFPGTNVRSMHRPVEEGLARWRARNGCPDTSREVEARRGRAGTVNAGQTATLLVWEPCATAATVALWKLSGVGHGWPGSEDIGLREEIIGPPTTLLDAAEVAWRFFERSCSRASSTTC